MSVALRCRDVRFDRSNAFSLTIDELSIPSGSVVVVEGPNGSGKTTLLWLLCGLLEPSRGSITAFDERLALDDLDVRRRMTLVMESPYLLRSSVRRNVEYGLARRGIKRPERRRRVDEALRRVRMEHLAERMAWRLSQGERKRVALARALTLETEVLLLDEPTSFVDRKTALLIEELIEQLRGSTTIVISTHDVVQSRRIADDVVTLFDGRLSRVSHENVFEADAVVVDGRRVARLSPDWEIPLEPGPEGPVSLLVDPSRIQLSASAESGTSMVVSAMNVERHTVRVCLEGSPRLVVRLPRDRLGDPSLTLGGTVTIEVPHDAVRVLHELEPSHQV